MKQSKVKKPKIALIQISLLTKMKRNIVLVIAITIVILILAVIFLGQIYAEPKDTSATNQNSNTVTPTPTSKLTPTPTVQPTSTPSVSPTPQESIRINSVSIDNATAASVSASSQSGQDIVITKIILKDTSGNTLATDNSIHQTLPADGTSKDND
jgi:hypothetical protein